MQGLMGIRFIKKFRRKNKRKAMSFYMDAVKPTRTVKVTCESGTLENQPPQKKAFQQGNIETRNDISPAPCPQDGVDVNNV